MGNYISRWAKSVKLGDCGGGFISGRGRSRVLVGLGIETRDLNIPGKCSPQSYTPAFQVKGTGSTDLNLKNHLQVLLYIKEASQSALGY